MGPSRRGEGDGRGQPCPNVDAGAAQVCDAMSPVPAQVCSVARKSWRRCGQRTGVSPVLAQMWVSPVLAQMRAEKSPVPVLTQAGVTQVPSQMSHRGEAAVGQRVASLADAQCGALPRVPKRRRGYSGTGQDAAALRGFSGNCLSGNGPSGNWLSGNGTHSRECMVRFGI